MADPKKFFGGLNKVRERLMSAPDEARLSELLSHGGDKALPLMLPRANLSSDFVNQQAERVARQMLGEHVVSGKPKETFNLAGRSKKESQRVKGLNYKLSPTGTVAQEVPYAPRRGDLKVAVPGDQTVSNKILDEVNGVPIDSVQEGGAYYGLGQRHLDDPEFWKSNEEPAKRMQSKVDRVAELYEPNRVIGSHLAMGPMSNNFAMHFADANLRAIDWSKAQPNKIDIFDSIIAYGYKDPKTKEMVKFPNWPGLADREGALTAMKEDANLRKWFNNRMKTPTVTKPLGLPNGLDIQYAITEPRLRDMEINMTGLMTGELKPGALVEAAGTPHNTYSHRILGEAGGPQEVLTPFVIDFPDAAQHIASTKKPADFTGTIQKVFPHQLVDDQYLNQYGEYRDRIKELTGQKEGGAVDMEAADARLAQAIQARMANGGAVDMEAADARLQAAIQARMGGEKVAHMAGGGGKLKALGDIAKKFLVEPETAQKIIQAPSIIIPSKISNVKEAVRQSKGDYGAKRVERAADEIPNLERLYKEEALKQVFQGDNAKPLMTMNPADFEKYAMGLPTRTVTEPNSLGDKTKMSTEDYLKYLRTLPEGFNDIPFLDINKQEQGLPLMPFISGHEGRHRNRAMAGGGEKAGLVTLFPRTELREGFPRKTQEEYIEALKKELEMTGNLVLPQYNRHNPIDVQRPAIELPDIYAKGGGVHMAGGGDSLDQFSPPRYRSAGRRPESQQDRKAAANMPMDFARGLVSGIGGAPGDIESLIRMLPGLDERTILPTSEDIEKRLPFRSDTPAGQAASGLGTLAGGFYTGPGAPIRLVGGLPKAVMKAGKDFTKAAGQPAANVVKPTGGNFLLGRTEKDLQPLKTPTFVGETPAQRISKHEELLKNPTLSQDQRDRVQRMLDATKGEAAIDKWVDSNLTNYVKKQMGTADDPVRKLAEEGITHKPGLVDEYRRTEEALKNQRREAGFPEEGMGQSPTAKAWERASDEAIATHRAGDIQGMPEKFAKRAEAEKKMIAARKELDQRFENRVENAGLNDREKASLIRRFSDVEKATMLNDVNYKKLRDEYLSQDIPMMDNYMELGRQNPYINKLAPDTPMYAPFTGDLGFDHIMDVLREDVTAGRIRPEQLSKVSMEQAVRRTFEYDQELAAKMNASRAAAREGLPTYKEYPEGYKWIQLNKPGSFSQESEAMGHSVRGYEPPKGHPDWTEGSGDAGSSGYGYGGWEAIKSGKAKVYSLVDSKGAPHATVETKQIGMTPEQRRYKVGFLAAQLEKEGKTAEDALRQAEKIYPDELKESISQIKGKGNRAPNEEYLPYIQDFVKGGQWSDVGDLRNTGLTRKSDLIDKFSPDELDAIGAGEYLTKAEQDDLLLRALRPPEEGMAHGGALSKLQFMDNGGLTTSGGTFSPEELGVSASDLSVMDDKTWNAIKRNAPGVYEEAKQKMKDEASQLKSARGIKDFALRVGASYAGGIPDLANFLLMAPDAVLGTELASDKPYFGSEQYIDAMRKAGLLGENEFPIAETVAGLLTPAGLIKKGVKKGVQLFNGKKPEAPKKRRGGLAAMAR